MHWELLRRQKLWLLQFDNEEAVGLANLIDNLQDEAVASGEATELEVFGGLV